MKISLILGSDICKRIPRRMKPRLTQAFCLVAMVGFTLLLISIRNLPLKHRSKKQKPVVSFNPEALKFRPEHCYNCNPHNYELLINNNDICAPSKESPEINVLILIASTHNGRQQRDTYRNTWLTYTRNNTGDIRYAFIFGNRNDTTANERLLEESNTYHDILQEDFQDSYINLTIKTMMAYKWASEHCGHAKYLMKTDDDMYVNIPGVLRAIRENAEELKTSIGGKCNTLKADPVRDKTSKWYVSYQYYAREFFPGYCSGTGYITSMAMVQDVFKVSKHVPFFYLEDVFVSLCIEKLGKSLHLIEGFHSGMALPIDSRVYKHEDMITSHRVATELLVKLWNDGCHGDLELPADIDSFETPWKEC